MADRKNSPPRTERKTSIIRSAKEGPELERELKEMKQLYDRLFKGNREFVENKLAKDPEFFQRLSNGQNPRYLLIGCSDSRVPPDQLTRTEPGDIFIHRNVANLIVNTDLNFMAVLQYAVEVLKVKHVIVMGHYGCGGVRASMERTHHGLIDKWLRNIKDVQRLHWELLCSIEDDEQRFRTLVELNVKEQVINLCKTSIIQAAWARGQTVAVHGWVYDLASGFLHELPVDNWHEIEDIYRLEFPTIKAPPALRRRLSTFNFSPESSMPLDGSVSAEELSLGSSSTASLPSAGVGGMPPIEEQSSDKKNETDTETDSD